MENGISTIPMFYYETVTQKAEMYQVDKVTRRENQGQSFVSTRENEKIIKCMVGEQTRLQEITEKSMRTPERG